MPVVSSTHDTDALTLTIVTEHDADVAHVWQVWADPRQLERWWGPPTWPATFDEHELTVGARSSYYMTGPDGEKAGGWWRITAVDEPRSLEFDDGFASADGQPVPTEDTSHAVVTLEDLGGRTRMTITSSFSSPAHLEMTLSMGMEEGMGLALGQVDALLAG